MKDKYDDAVQYLMENPTEIYRSWVSADVRIGKGGELFLWCGPEKDPNEIPSFQPGKECGCLTQIRSVNAHRYAAFTLGLTKKILSDDRIPRDPSGITVDKLPLFAAWQRFMDKYFASGCDDALLTEEVMP